MTPCPEPVIVNILITSNGEVTAVSNCPGVELKITNSERMFGMDLSLGLPHEVTVIKP